MQQFSLVINTLFTVPWTRLTPAIFISFSVVIVVFKSWKILLAATRLYPFLHCLPNLAPKRPSVLFTEAASSEKFSYCIITVFFNLWKSLVKALNFLILKWSWTRTNYFLLEFFFKNLFYAMHIIDWQCCVNFCCTTKWFRCIFFFIFFSIIFTGYWIEFSVLYSRTLLFIYPMYNSLHLLIPNLESIPLLTPLPWQPQVCCSLSVSLLRRQVHLCHISDATYKG